MDMAITADMDVADMDTATTEDMDMVTMAEMRQVDMDLSQGTAVEIQKIQHRAALPLMSK